MWQVYYSQIKERCFVYIEHKVINKITMKNMYLLLYIDNVLVNLNGVLYRAIFKDTLGFSESFKCPKDKLQSQRGII
jgi:hypothetical protein